MTDFIERLMKNASNSEVLSFKRPIEQKFSSLMANSPDVNLDDVCDFKFVGNYAAIQSGVKSTFGYIRSVLEPEIEPRSLCLSTVSSVGTL